MAPGLDERRFDDIDEIVDRIYAAVPYPDRWPAPLERMRLGAGAAGASLTIAMGPAGGGRARLLRFTSSGYDPALSLVYRARLHEEDPYVAPALAALPPALVLGRDHVDAAALAKTAFFRRWLEPQGLADPIILVAAARRDAALHAVVRLDRAAAAPPWSDRQIAFARRLLPHVARALDITLRCRGEMDDLSTVLRTLDHLPSGLALLDRDGRVVYANRVARAILEAGEGVRTGARGDLEARDAADRKALAALLRDALARGAGGTIPLRRPREAPPILLTVPPSPAGPALFGGAALAVLLSDPARSRRMGAALTRTFGLTRAEARVAEGLASGLAPKEIAFRLRSKVATVRTHLKSIYAKMRVGRQPDLVRMVSDLSTLIS
jgi:DNA-binding CsgD family transcriptional regulator